MFTETAKELDPMMCGCMCLCGVSMDGELRGVGLGFCLSFSRLVLRGGCAWVGNMLFRRCLIVCVY